DAFFAELVENGGNIDSFTAEKDFFLCRSVYLTRYEGIHSHDIVERRVEGNSINHASTSFTTVCLRNSGFGRLSVMIHDFSTGAEVTETTRLSVAWSART